MTDRQIDLFVFGGDGPVGEVVVRYAQSLGHRVTAVGGEGPPDREEPWVEGADWRSAGEAEGLDLEEADVVVDARWPVGDTEPDRGADEAASRLEEVIRVAAASDVSRVVGVVPAGGESVPSDRGDAEPAGVEVTELAVSAVQPGASLVDEGGAIERGLPPEQLGMALLRAAVEGEARGRVGPGEVAELGRSVVLQGE